MNFLGLGLAAVIASAAWLYQRAWERQEKRVERYQKVMDTLVYFTEKRLTAAKQDEMILEHHRLWLSAPDDVVKTGEKFLDAIEGVIYIKEGGQTKEEILGEYVLAMRRDASIKSALWPRFWQTKLQPIEFRLRSANQNNPQMAAK